MLKAEVSIFGNQELSQAASRVLQRCFEVEGQPVLQRSFKRDGNTKAESPSDVLISLCLTKVFEPSWKEEDQPFSKEDKAKRIMLLDKLLKKHGIPYKQEQLQDLLEIVGEYLEGIPYT